MKIALIGYGKMGHEIEQIAIGKGHEVILKIDHHNLADLTAALLKQADVAIEFTAPHSAYSNILKCFEAGIPVVCGTTGWLDKMDEIKKVCTEQNQTFFYASNYSVGVNLFFELNKYLARLMKNHPGFAIEMEEVHHTQKADYPSGTGITLAEGIINNSIKTKWVAQLEGTNTVEAKADELLINSVRTEKVPGTHIIKYTSDVDSIEIKHTAFSRQGFAAGAVKAAEWVVGKKGVFGMNDLMN